MDDSRRVSLAKAASELNTTEVKVLMLLKQKQLEGELVDGEWWVSVESLACLKRHGLSATAVTSCRTHCSSSGCGCR